MAVKVDLRDAVEFQPVPAGVYDLRVVDAEETVSDSGNGMIVWEFEIINCEDDDVNGKKLKYWTVYEGKGAGMIADLVSVWGIQWGKAANAEEPFEFECQDYIGHTLKGQVKIKTHNGKQVNNIVRLFPSDDSESAEDEE